MSPAPPVRLTTITRWSMYFSTYLASSRAVTSIPPPAGYTTTNSIGWVGKSFGLSPRSFAFGSPCAPAPPAIPGTKAHRPSAHVDFYRLWRTKVLSPRVELRRDDQGT